MADEHEWFKVAFSYASWVECECGFQPLSQEEFDSHAKEFGL